MSATLYILRQQPIHISPSLFQPGDTDMDIVFLEKAVEMVPSSIQGAVIAGERVEVDEAHSILTYDDLVEKIFSSDRVIVL